MRKMTVLHSVNVKSFSYWTVFDVREAVVLTKRYLLLLFKVVVQLLQQFCS